MQIQVTFLVIGLVWLLVLTGFSAWILLHVKRFSDNVDKGNLIKVLEKVLKKEEDNSKDIKKLEDFVNQIDEDINYHIQKVGLVRFNPFEEMGGDHSFSLALLDKKDTGFIVTGLHTRERTRVYVKEVKSGASKIDLSKEEEKALKKAINEN